MNEFTKERLKRIRPILERHLLNITAILDGQATNYEVAAEMSWLLDDLDNKSHFKQDCKEVEQENYRLSEEGVANE